MRTHPVRVAIDLETTGLHPDQDAVIEIGALKFAGDEVLDTFDSFVATSIPLPYRIQRLTGITPAQLKTAPTLNELVPGLRAFLGEWPLVGHSVQFDAAFLRRVGLARRNPLVDTYELASMLLPDLPSYTLASVGVALGVSSPTYHRALADAQLARDVFLSLFERLEQLDAGTLEALSRLSAPADWTPAYFIRTLMRAQRGARSAPAAGTLGEQLAAKLGMDPSVLALAVAPGSNSRRLAAPKRAAAVGPSAESPTPEPAPIPEGAQGALQAISTGVALCLAEGGPLLVEVESDPASLQTCLVAALRWLAEHEGQVIVSAANLDAMNRIARHVLPGAFAVAEIELASLPVAELAEQDSYLCLHRWFGAARESRNGVLPRDVARGLAKMTVWAASTQTGLRSEVALGGQELVAWERARAGADFVESSATCTYRRDGYCFVSKARQRATEARVVVTTHTALAARLTGAEPGLPDGARIIVLDAHLLEDELRRSRGFTLDPQDIYAQLAALAQNVDGGGRGGLLHLAAERLARKQGAEQRTNAWFAQVRRARQAADAFFRAARGVLLEAQADQRDRPRGEPVEQRTLQVNAEVRRRAGWGEVERCWAEMCERLAAVAKLAREAAAVLLAAGGRNAPLASDGVATDLVASAGVLERLCTQGNAFFEAADTEQVVHWLRVPYANQTGQTPETSGPRTRRPGKQRSENASVATPPDSGSSGDTGAGTQGNEAPDELAGEAVELPALHSAPIAVAPLLQPLLVPERALVLAGPALSVAGDFTYTRGSLGLPDGVQTLGPTIDRAEQTLLCLPTDVPEPNAHHYQRHLDDALIALATELGGRLVAIFPSHAALRASAHGIRRALERDNILVMAQGQDGSARQLWQTFRTEQRVVLLGAGSFWEGAEQVEQPPACVVVTRIPFPALSDPLLATLADTWNDPQSQFVVPTAALRIRQALGGLAWSHQQRNAVVLFDRRAQTRNYGATLLGTLPRCTHYAETMAQIAERVPEWVGQ